MALGAVLALSLSAAGAAGKPAKCAPGAEAAGCTLSDGARFYKKVSGAGAITVQTGSKGVSITAFSTPIKCTKFAPMLGNEQELAVGLSSGQRPKVGKSYVMKAHYLGQVGSETSCDGGASWNVKRQS